MNKNGEFRKQFSQWAIPVNFRHELDLRDGTACVVSIQLGSYSVGKRSYVLTSGGEIRIPKAIADTLKEKSRAEPSAEIVLKMDCGTNRQRIKKLRKINEDAAADEASDPHNSKDARERIEAIIVQRRGQPKFRKKLLEAYNNRCAISGCDCPDALKAAHIQPYMGVHTNHTANGILLRSDLHTLLDLGKISISSDFRVIVSLGHRRTVYGKLHNQEIKLPEQKSLWPKIS